MCPVCAATTLAWITAGVTSTGVTTLVVSRLQNKNPRDEQSDPGKNKE